MTLLQLNAVTYRIPGVKTDGDADAPYVEL